jgi:hypothetical protein
VVAYLALFVALSGTAWSAAKIGPRDIERNAVKSRHIADGAVRAADVADDTTPHALTGEDIAADSLRSVDLGQNSVEPSEFGTLWFETEQVSVPDEQTVFLPVHCDPGYEAISGGADFVQDAPGVGPEMMISSLFYNGSGFTARGFNLSGGTRTFVTSALCLSPNGGG